MCQGLGVFKLRDTNQEKEERLAPLYFDIWLSNFAVISNLFYFSPISRLLHNSATLFFELMKWLTQKTTSHAKFKVAY